MSARAWKRRRAKRYDRAFDALIASQDGLGSYQLGCEQNRLMAHHISTQLGLPWSDINSSPLADFQATRAYERGRF